MHEIKKEEGIPEDEQIQQEKEIQKFLANNV